MKTKCGVNYLAALALALAAGPAPGAELRVGEQEIEGDEPIKLELKWELDILFLGAFRSEEDDGREVELRDVKTQEEAAWRDILTRHGTLGTPHWFH